jgi:hypothetical protein
MTMNETDQQRELDHTDENYGVDSDGDEVADEQAAEAQADEPVPGYFETDDATPSDHDGDGDGHDDDGDAIALGQGDAADVTLADDLDDDETDASVADELDEDTDDTIDTTDTDTDDEDSVLLTESTPGSVLPPEDDTDTAVDDTDVLVDDTDDGAVETEVRPVPEVSPAASLEPVGPDTPLDPGAGTYQERWSAIQGGFVDEPLRAVESAGSLVAQMWHDFERSITERRDALDGGWATESSTDDLREAFKEYRELFNRLTDLLTD